GEVGDEPPSLRQFGPSRADAPSQPQPPCQQCCVSIGRRGQKIDRGGYRLAGRKLFAQAAQHRREDIAAVGPAEGSVPSLAQSQVAESVAIGCRVRVEQKIVTGHTAILPCSSRRDTVASEI